MSADTPSEAERSAAEAAYQAGKREGELQEPPLVAAPGRWAFLDPETGDWIEVKPGVVHVARLAADTEAGS